MLKTLKITSILVALTALAVVVMLVIFGLKGDVGIEEYLGLPGAVEKFRKLAKPANGQQDATSPLVNAALAFVLRIDPPPPPKPKPKSRPKSKPKPVVAKVTPKKAPPPPKPKKKVVNVKFKLVATCRYDDRPEKSLALLNLTSKGTKWFRQGEEVGHLVIQEIKDGSIVLYKDGQENSEISVPKVVSKIRSLLKSDQDASTSKPGSSDPSVTLVKPSKKTASTQPEPDVVRNRVRRAPNPAAATATRPSTTPASATTTRRPARRVPNRRVTSRKPTPRPKPQTPEERKASLDKSIAGVKDAIGRTKGKNASKDMEIWQKLLDSLEKDKGKVGKQESEAKKGKKTK